jgi:hypothetical protein
MDLTVRPIDVWPDGWRVPRERKPNPFRVRSYEQTLDQLHRELDHIAARAAHLQLDVQPGQLRRDGHLRSSARVDHPGVILTVDTRRLGVLTYPCDTFEARWAGEPPSWQINLRAIALGLEALRKVERYGIAERGQQYAGFGALPPGGPVAVGAAMTVEEAARLLALAAGRLTGVSDVSGVAAAAQDLWRAASKTHHPDAGGDPDTFRRLTEARDLLLQEADRG